MTIRKTPILLVLLGMAVVPACRRDADPPPRSVAGVAGPLAPVVVPARLDDRSIIASAGPLPEAQGSPGETMTDNPPPADNPPGTREPEGKPPEKPTAEAIAEPSEGTGGDAATDQPAAQPPPADQTESTPPPRPERRREEVDEVYSGPGMLRGR